MNVKSVGKGLEKAGFRKVSAICNTEIIEGLTSSCKPYVMYKKQKQDIAMCKLHATSEQQKQNFVMCKNSKV